MHVVTPRHLCFFCGKLVDLSAHSHDAFSSEHRVVQQFFADAAANNEHAESNYRRVLGRSCYSEYFRSDVPCISTHHAVVDRQFIAIQRRSRAA